MSSTEWIGRRGELDRSSPLEAQPGVTTVARLLTPGKDWIAGIPVVGASPNNLEDFRFLLKAIYLP